MGRAWGACLGVVLCLSACTADYWVRNTGRRLAEVEARAPVIKLHLASGEVYILSSWTLEGTPSSPTAIRGTGQLLDSSRRPAESRVHVVPISAIALYETNTRMERSSGPLSTLGWVTGTLYVAGLALLYVFLAGGGLDEG
jgi:hypothetical protein